MLPSLCMPIPTTPDDACGWSWARTFYQAGKAGQVLDLMATRDNPHLAGHAHVRNLLDTYKARHVPIVHDDGWEGYVLPDRTALLLRNPLLARAPTPGSFTLSPFPVVLDTNATDHESLSQAARAHPRNTAGVAYSADALEHGCLALPWISIRPHPHLHDEHPVANALEAALTSILYGCVVPALESLPCVQKRDARTHLILNLYSAKLDHNGGWLPPYVVFDVTPYAPAHDMFTPDLANWGRAIGATLATHLPSPVRAPHVVSTIRSTKTITARSAIVSSVECSCAELTIPAHARLHHTRWCQDLGAPAFPFTYAPD